MSEKKQHSDLWSACAHCQAKTKHQVLCSVETRLDEDSPDHVSYEIVQCLGCERHSFREERHDVEQGWYDEAGDWDYPTTVKTFSKILEGHRDFEEEYLIPKRVCVIYKESVLAIKEGARLLAGIGLRSTLEAICAEQTITARDAAKKMDQLALKGLITKKDAERLHGIRFLGNDAAHDLKRPTMAQLLVALKIIDHLLNSLYVFEHEVKGQLEHGIGTVEELIDLLAGNLGSFKMGDEHSLRTLLGKHFRRLVGPRLAELEDHLKLKIQEGSYSDLVFGEVVNVGKKETDKVQRYKVNTSAKSLMKSITKMKQA